MLPIRKLTANLRIHKNAKKKDKPKFPRIKMSYNLVSIFALSFVASFQTFPMCNVLQVQIIHISSIINLYIRHFFPKIAKNFTNDEKNPQMTKNLISQRIPY